MGQIIRIFRLVASVPKSLALVLIRIYQKTLSPDHGPLKNQRPYGFCRFYPSCSEYSYLIIKKQGLVIGLAKSVWRILRCNPWSQGGVDMP